MKGQTYNPTPRTGNVTIAERAREVKARCPIEVVAAQYREVKPSGLSRFVCRCLCGRNPDRRPSFTLYRRDNGFHCFACGAHGSVIDLVMLAEGCDFRTALLRLEGYAGPAVLQRPELDHPRSKSNAPLAPLDQHILNAAAECYHAQLHTHPKPLRYLMSERGLTPPTIHKLKMGYSDGGALIRHIHQSGLPVTRLLTLGLITGRFDEMLCRRVIFPVLRGEIAVYMIGRAMERGGTRVKYLGLPDGLVHKQPMLLGTPTRGVIWVEGPFDVAALVQWGLDANYLLIALLGTAYMHAVERLQDHFANVPHYIALDQDDAGEQAASAMMNSLHTTLQAEQVRRLRWSGAKDCGALLPHGQQGQDRFLHALYTPA
jgi:DNA primase